MIKRPVQTNDRNIRTLQGFVAADGSIQAGEGFSVTKNGTGDYTVTLKEAGRKFISAVATVLNATGATGHFAKLLAADKASVKFGIYVADGTDGAPSDQQFCFSITVKDSDT